MRVALMILSLVACAFADTDDYNGFGAILIFVVLFGFPVLLVAVIMIPYYICKYLADETKKLFTKSPEEIAEDKMAALRKKMEYNSAQRAQQIQPTQEMQPIQQAPVVIKTAGKDIRDLFGED
jgi:hypothetical protein